MTRITLKDIARHVGVSVMTVSNVVNGNLARVSPDTAVKVTRAVEELGYVPSAAARSLAARRTRLVGLLLPSRPDDVSLLASPHDVAVAGGIEAALRARDHHLMLRGVDGPRDVHDSVQRWALDGIILMGFTDAELGALDLPSGVPTVVVDADFGADPALVHVRSDDFEGGRLAAVHLAALGHRRYAFCGPVHTTSRVISERLRGFQAGLAQAGADPEDFVLIQAETTYDSGTAVGTALGSLPTGERPTAIFATADILAAGLLRGLTGAGVAVPAEVSVVGYDDADLAVFVTPRLTTIAQDTARKGQVAANLLLSVIESAAQPESSGIDVSLVIRESTAPATP